MATYIKPEAIKDGSLPIEKIDNVALDLAEKVNALDNSNKTLFLNKINAMPATPSGDPMHWAYVAAGATYNAESGFWSYGQIFLIDGKWHGLTDLTNADMRYAFLLNPSFSFITPISGQWGKSVLKTRIAFSSVNSTAAISLAGAFNQNDNIEFIKLSETNVLPTSLLYTFYGCKKLKTIVTRLELNYMTTASNVNEAFSNCILLENVCIHNIKVNLGFKDSPSLSNASILYMINNEAATSPITVTLHKTAYARAMADESILAALEAHTNISLASA